MKKSLTRTMLMSGMLACLLASPVSAAPSGTTTADVTITAGSLDLMVPDSTVSFPSIPVDGTMQTRQVGFSSPLQVEDFRGTGQGWNVTVQATPFQQVGGSAGLTLPTGSLSLRGPSTIMPAANAPTSSSSPWIIDGAAVKILSATAGNGAGSFAITFPAGDALRLSVDTSDSSSLIDPASPGGTQYESVLTWQVSTGP